MDLTGAQFNLEDFFFAITQERDLNLGFRFHFSNLIGQRLRTVTAAPAPE